jgi:hypothetical protein
MLPMRERNPANLRNTEVEGAGAVNEPSNSSALRSGNTGYNPTGDPRAASLPSTLPTREDVDDLVTAFGARQYEHGEQVNGHPDYQELAHEKAVEAREALDAALDALCVALSLLAEIRRVMALRHADVLKEYVELNPLSVERSGYVSIQVMRNWLVWNAIQIHDWCTTTAGRGEDVSADTK